MDGKIDKLFVVKRNIELEVLYYCPKCESINEIYLNHPLNALICRECMASLTAQDAVVEAIQAADDEF